MPRENLERNFGFILNDVARLLRKVYDRRVRALGGALSLCPQAEHVQQPPPPPGSIPINW